jgi:hypothetical protein
MDLSIKRRVDKLSVDKPCQTRFKECKRSIFYAIIKRMGYKYSYNNKIAREEIVKTERIQKKKLKNI